MLVYGKTDNKSKSGKLAILSALPAPGEAGARRKVAANLYCCFHARLTTSVTVLPVALPGGDSLLLTTSEDTSVKLLHLGRGGAASPLGHLSEHTDVVKCAAVCQRNPQQVRAHSV